MATFQEEIEKRIADQREGAVRQVLQSLTNDELAQLLKQSVAEELDARQPIKDLGRAVLRVVVERLSNLPDARRT